MPIRIYALAKELKLDSKVLADICTKAGVTGKGSALASLTDEEAVLVKQYVAGGKKGAPVRPGAAGQSAPGVGTAAIRREDYMGPGGTVGKPPVLTGRPPEKPPLARHREAEEAAAPPAVAEPGPVETPPAPVDAPETPSVEAPPAPVAEADAPSAVETKHTSGAPAVPPLIRQGPVQDLSNRPQRPGMPSKFDKPPLLDRMKGKDRQRSEKSDRPERQGLAIKLAPMPAPPSRPITRASEPAPQKPDLRLPLDAIRASKSGEKPLSDHLKKAEQKRRTGGRKGAPPELPPLPDVVPEVLPGDRDRKRKTPAVEGGEDEMGSTLGGREHRQLKRKRTKPAQARVAGEEGETTVVAKRPQRIRRTGANTAAPRKSQQVLHLPCTVRAFSEALGMPARNVLGKLLALGVTTANINADLSGEMAELLAVELGVELEIRKHVNLEDQVISTLDQQPDDPANLEPRAPVVTFLGHVDHGKTSLLDRILGLKVAASEKGGITQHIRAYRIEKDGRPIAFVDTPGHEAFTAMRARGANVTDVAVLVVAGDDGVMPQTEEAISHARAAGVPIVVALNKMDLPGVNIDRIYQQLAANELLPSQWGGDVEVVHTSATTGKGIDELLETILTVAELHEYKANPNRPASGTCLEAEMHEERGVIVKVLVQNGTLHVGDVILCGPSYGRVKAMYDPLHPEHRVEAAGPATPVQVIGLNTAPGAGDRFHALEGISQARELAETRAAENRQETLGGLSRPHVTLESLYQRLEQDEEIRTLNIVLRADTRGSIEAIRKELSKLDHPEVQIKILQATVGGVTEADVHLADASDAVIIAFSVVPDEKARGLAEQRGVQIRRYDIIYQVSGDLKAALEGMLKPEEKIKELGRLLILRVFKISRVGAVGGCRVLAGNVARDSRIRVIRENRVIGDYGVDSLKREKDDVREVREGMECGVKLAGFDDLKEGDVLEAYKVEEIARTF